MLSGITKKGIVRLVKKIRANVTRSKVILSGPKRTAPKTSKHVMIGTIPVLSFFK